MVAKAETTERQHGPRCTWCAHRPHAQPCPKMIIVATAPSHGNKTPTASVPCPCAKPE